VDGDVIRVGRMRPAGGGAGASWSLALMAGAYHLLTLVHVLTTHLSYFTFFTTTEAATLIAASKPQVKRNKCEHGLSPSLMDGTTMVMTAASAEVADIWVSNLKLLLLGGAVQVELSCPISRKRMVSTIEPVK
jgi:hypothetical protein